MDAEQTWPTEEELAQAAAAQKKKIVKKVPKGTSEYQAAWIPDEDGGIFHRRWQLILRSTRVLYFYNFSDELTGSSDDESDQMSVDEAEFQADSDIETEEDEEEYETVTISEAAPDEQRYDQNIDMTEEKEAMEKLKRTFLKLT